MIDHRIINTLFFIVIAMFLMHLISCAGEGKPSTPIFTKVEETPKPVAKKYSTPRTLQTSKATTTIPINLEYNMEKFEKNTLSKKLLEISALSIDSNNDELYAVNDEKAFIYKLNLKGEVLEKFDFGKNADYEGIEKINNNIYVLKANGKIISYDILNESNVRTYDNPLTLSNDTEGLGYDPLTNSLLIACKGSPNIKSNPKLKKSKSVYAFNLDTKEMDSTPFMTISDKAIKDYLEQSTFKDLSKKKYKKQLHRAKNFSPSAIARNPIDGNFYLLSTVGKTLIVLDRSSTILKIHFLDDAAYIQPEGICFNTSGDMFISNEGKGLRSNIINIKFEK